MSNRLAINEFTTPRWSFEEDVLKYAQSGVKHIGVLRHKLETYGVKRGIQLLNSTQMQVSSLCMGGPFIAQEEQERQRQIEETIKAVEIAGELAANTLILMAGPAGIVPRELALQYMHEGLAAVLPHAQNTGVLLALEPMHPMYATESSFLCTLEDALAVVAPFPSEQVGVVVDSYHLWWQADLLPMIKQAGSRLFIVQLSDWKRTTRSFYDRELPGKGIINWEELLTAIEEIGYRGKYEIEILSYDLWSKPPAALLNMCLDAYQTVISPYILHE